MINTLEIIRDCLKKQKNNFTMIIDFKNDNIARLKLIDEYVILNEGIASFWKDSKGRDSKYEYVAIKLEGGELVMRYGSNYFTAEDQGKGTSNNSFIINYKDFGIRATVKHKKKKLDL